MGMTIDKAILRVEHSSMFLDDKETADFIINTMRKYQKIEELYDYWRSGKCEYTISCMENIGKVLEDETDKTY